MSNGMIAGLDVSLNAGLESVIRVNVRQQGERVELNWYTFQGAAYDEDMWRRMQEGEEVEGVPLDVSVALDDESAVEVGVPALAAGKWRYIISATAGGSDTIPFLRGVLGVFAPDVVLAAHSERELEAVLDLPSAIAELPEGVGKCRAHWLVGTKAEAAARKAAEEALGWIKGAVLTGFAVVPTYGDLPVSPTESQKNLRWVVSSTGKTYVWSSEPVAVRAEWLLQLDNAGADAGYEDYWMYSGRPGMSVDVEPWYLWRNDDTYSTAASFASKLNSFFTAGQHPLVAEVSGRDIVIKATTSTDEYNDKITVGADRSSKGCGYTVTQTVYGGVGTPGWAEIVPFTGVPDATTTIKGISRLAEDEGDSSGVVTMGLLQEILAGYVQAPDSGSVVTSESVEHVEVVDELPPTPDSSTLYIKPVDEA